MQSSDDKTLPPGETSYYWKLQHVPLTATKQFQVEFEVHKGAGESSGGFSIDDINLSETECPHVTMNVDYLANRMKFASSFRASFLYSQRHYTSDGYAYAFGLAIFKRTFGLFVQLLSGKNDDKLKWPLLDRQVTFQMVDQHSNIQLQMSKQRSITSDASTDNDGKFKRT